MKTGNRKNLIGGGLALLIALAMSVAVGFAQGRPDNGGGERGEHGMHGGSGRDGGFGHFGRNLNLTDAQKTQMQQIGDRFKASTKGLHEQLRNLDRNSDAVSDNGTFNESAVRQAAQARANLEVELEVSHARMMSEMFAVLTPEQKTQLAQQRQQWQQKREQHEQGMNHSNDTQQ
jgi:protein CpxP